VHTRWRGFASPLRYRPAVGSCLFDDHQIWWHVEAESADKALEHLPWYVAARTTSIRIAELPIP
jgi:hypothetical protein